MSSFKKSPEISDTYSDDMKEEWPSDDNQNEKNSVTNQNKAQDNSIKTSRIPVKSDKKDAVVTSTHIKNNLPTVKMLGAIESVRESDPEISDSIDDSEVPLGQYPTSTISQKAILPNQAH